MQHGQHGPSQLRQPGFSSSAAEVKSCLGSTDDVHRCGCVWKLETSTSELMWYWGCVIISYYFTLWLRNMRPHNLGPLQPHLQVNLCHIRPAQLHSIRAVKSWKVELLLSWKIIDLQTLIVTVIVFWQDCRIHYCTSFWRTYHNKDVGTISLYCRGTGRPLQFKYWEKWNNSIQKPITCAFKFLRSCIFQTFSQAPFRPSCNPAPQHCFRTGSEGCWGNTISIQVIGT